MDLNTLKPIEGATVELVHPATGEQITDDKGKPFTITVMGADSDKYRTLQRRALEKSLANRKGQKVDLEESNKKGVELLAKVTTACHIQMDGKLIDCDFETMIGIYSQYHWIKEQVEAFIADRANFIKS